MIYEFCAENFERVPAAIVGGAGRIELCDNLAVGGTTPSIGTIQMVTDYCHDHQTRVFCMIRPRGGSFCYSDAELDVMDLDLCAACGLGVDGVVFGCVANRGGSNIVDERALSRLMEAVSDARGAREGETLDLTFHMAFDALESEAQLDAIDMLSDCGFTRILTHGGAAGTPIEENLDHLSKLIEYAGDRLKILPGGGITTVNRDAVAAALGVEELHGTGIVPLEA